MLVTYFVNFRWLNDQLFGKELLIRFTASAFRKLLSVYVFSYFPFGFEGRMRDVIVSVPDHCLSFYFSKDTDYSENTWSGSRDINAEMRILLLTVRNWRIYSVYLYSDVRLLIVNR